MNIKILCATSFISGVAIGALISFKYAEKYYREIAEEEIDSVVNQFNKLNVKKYKKTTPSDDKTCEFVTMAEVNANRSKNNGDDVKEEYVDYTKFFDSSASGTDDEVSIDKTTNISDDSSRVLPLNTSTDENKETSSTPTYPYYIEKDDCDSESYSDFEKVHLTILKDETVLELDGNIIEDISSIIGHKISNDLKNADFKTVHYICCESTKTIYEIYIDSRTYSEYLDGDD